MQQNRPLAIIQPTYIVDQLATVWHCFYRILKMKPPLENDHDPSFDVLCLIGNFIRRLFRYECALSPGDLGVNRASIPKEFDYA